MQGMMFGAGGEVARRAIDGVAGPRSMQVEHVGQDQNSSPVDQQQQSNLSCDTELGQFNTCLKDSANQLSSCQFYFDVLNQCQQRA